jgi:hypothetical protein
MGTITAQQLTTRRELVTEYNALKAAKADLIAGRVSSINVSTGTGSKSFTKISLAELRKEMTIIAQQIQAIDNSGRPAIKRVGFRSH